MPCLDYRIMTSYEWKTYRTRFLVKAKQLNSNLTFTDPLGRQHCGRKGDYLVESCEGVISIAPRQIFEDIYVPINATDLPPNPRMMRTFSAKFLHPENSTEVIGPLTVNLAPAMPRRRRTSHSQFPNARRKSPQPLGSPRVPARLNLM